MIISDLTNSQDPVSPPQGLSDRLQVYDQACLCFSDLTGKYCISMNNVFISKMW